jgi:DNA-directed RNA polymerase specialized sigma24 family protein
MAHMTPAAQDAFASPQADDLGQLWDLLRDLSPHQGAILLLSVGFQLPQETVAALLGVPKNSVDQLCEGALWTLRTRAGVMCADR